MTLPLMHTVNVVRKQPVVTFISAADGDGPFTLTEANPRPDRWIVFMVAGTTTASYTMTGCTFNGIPASSIVTIGNTSFALACVPTGTSITVTPTYSTAPGGKLAVYSVVGELESPVFSSPDYATAAGTVYNTVTMIDRGIVFSALWSTNDNNAFTWSSPMVRTVNDTSLGTSRGASMAYRENTPNGLYTLSCSVGAGTMRMASVVLR